MYANYEFNTAQGLLSNMYIGFIFFTVLLSFIILALSKKFNLSYVEHNVNRRSPEKNKCCHVG